MQKFRKISGKPLWWTAKFCWSSQNSDRTPPRRFFLISSARLFFFKFWKFFARYLCHSLSSNVGSLQFVSCNVAVSKRFQKLIKLTLNSKCYLHCVKGNVYYWKEDTIAIQNFTMGKARCLWNTMKAKKIYT